MTAAAGDKNSTPMMLQYRRAKASLSPGTLLFFRLGDFYEMFFDDALEGSELLGLTLTKRQGVPMCGIPYHAAEMYLGKLLKAGRKVALCDQMEDPALAKGLVKREVTSIVTPGTVLSESVLEAGKSNYLAGVHRSGKAWGLAMLELSTGEFWMEETGSAEAACADLALQSPAANLLRRKCRPNFSIKRQALSTNSSKASALWSGCAYCTISTLLNW